MYYVPPIFVPVAASCMAIDLKIVFHPHRAGEPAKVCGKLVQTLTYEIHSLGEDAGYVAPWSRISHGNEWYYKDL